MRIRDAGLIALFLIVTVTAQALQPVNAQDNALVFDSGSERIRHFSVSADGSLVAFATAEDGNQNIYLLDRATGDRKQLTDQPGRDVVPSLSPDGRNIVFTSDRSGAQNLWLLDLETGTTGRLTGPKGSQYGADWSPDGKSIAYLSNETGNWDLWTLILDGGDPVRVTDNPGNEYWPTWSPDGRKLAFYTTWTDWTDLWIADLRTGELTEVLVSDREDYWPSWSADGAWIIFSSDRADPKQDSDLWAIRPSGGDPVRLSYEETGFKAHVRATGGGRRAMFSISRKHFNLFTIDAADGTGERQITEGLGADTNPVVAPDGKSVVFESLRDGFHLFQKGIKGGRIKQLTAGRSAEYQPIFGPWGESIIYIKGRGDRKDNDLWSMSLASKRQTRLTTRGSLFGPSLCRDKDMLVVAGSKTREDPKLHLWRLRRAGGEAELLPGFAEASRDSGAACSTDGRYIAFTATRDGQQTLLIRPMDGGEGEAVAPGDFASRDGRWSPDGRKMAFAANDHGNYDIFVKDLDSGEITRLTSHTDDELAPAWTPDGTRIVFSRQSVQYEIREMALDLLQD